MSTKKKLEEEKRELQVENWNLKSPIGVSVILRKDGGEEVKTITTSEAYVMCGHTAVIHLEGVSGCYMLDRVKAA